MIRKVLRVLLPLLLLAAGAYGAWLLASARKPPERRPRPPAVPLVETLVVARQDVCVVVEGSGTVVPRTTVQVVPQVAGKVLEVHPHFAKGGTFRAGELLLRVEPADYELALRRTEAEVARAQTALDLERAQSEVARREWERLHPGEEPHPLVVRAPQLRQAEAELEAARARLAETRLALGRTRIPAPFDGRFVSESLDVGQYVTAGQPVAVVYATDVLEVPVPLEDRELRWIEVPLAGGEGSRAVVSARFAGERHEWAGRVVRSEGVDPASRMVTVVVAVRDRFDPSSGRPPLTPGMFVDVAVEGSSLEDVLAVPRHAIRAGDTAWVVEEGRLRVRAVEAARSTRETVYVAAGLADGDRVVLTPLDAVTDGMLVRTGADAAEEPGAPAAEDDPAPDPAGPPPENGPDGRRTE